MIQITIDTPEKISGIHAIHIKTEYNVQTIEIIKMFQPAIWLKNKSCWEVPVNNLTEILDKLTFIDDICLKLPTEKSSNSNLTELTEDELKSFRHRPYKHQIEAINYGLQKDKWLNLSTMGLGKTYEAICLAETLHRRGLIEHCMIICGIDGLRTNWKNELKEFTNETYTVLGERITKTGKITYNTLAERAHQLKEPISEFFIIVNITNIGDDGFVEAFKKSKNKIDMIIFDEAHRATKQSKRGDNLLKLDAKYKVAMTGSLLVNSPLSAYLSLAWTENDHATLTNFKQQYCEFGSSAFTKYQIVGYKNLDLLKEELDACSLRRTFAQVKGDMPAKTIEYETLEMNEPQKKFYEAIKAGVKEEADKIELNSNNLLALLTRLRQATSAPGVLTTDPPESIKIERAAELAEDLLEHEEKVVIMSNFKEPVYQLESKLKQFQPLVCTGDQPEDLINRNITNFRNSKNSNLLLCTMSKMGTGYSFPECHYMIFIDQPWSYSEFDQSVCRIYRITSDQPIFVKVLVCKDTVDEHVLEIVKNKKELSDFIIDNKNNSLAQKMRSIIESL